MTELNGARDSRRDYRSILGNWLTDCQSWEKGQECWKEAFIGRSPSVYNSINAVIINITFFRIFDSSAFIAESARNSHFLAFLNFTSNRL